MKSNENTITDCESSGCGWKCCNYGKDGHIILLPNEVESIERNAGNHLNHLEVIDDDYMGGKKVKCNAQDTSNCDGGYKPIQCSLYPLWFRTTDQENPTVEKSERCPLSEVTAAVHKLECVKIIDNYKNQNPTVEIDLFLQNATVNSYKNLKANVRVLTGYDLFKVKRIEESIEECETFIKSSYAEIVKCLLSHLSYGIFIDGNLVSYSLAYSDDYDFIAYVEKCVTVPEYRGNGYHSITLTECKKEAKKRNYYLVCSVVSPQNRISIKNFKNCNFEEVANRRNLFGGTNERLVMVCKL